MHYVCLTTYLSKCTSQERKIKLIRNTKKKKKKTKQNPKTAHKAKVLFN